MVALGDLLRFLETGGTILWLILAVTIFLMALLAERFWFVSVTFGQIRDRMIADWRGRSETHSWQARQIRAQMLSHAGTLIQAKMEVITVLVVLLPLLGLLGTVIGMIHLFDVMTITGSSNARAMAGGISIATFSTMAGMATAVVGIFASTRLKYMNDVALRKLGEQLHEGKS